MVQSMRVKKNALHEVPGGFGQCCFGFVHKGASRVLVGCEVY